MTAKTIHTFPVSPEDWMVREESGRELGHYPSQQEALRVGRKLARSRSAQLLIRDASGENPRPQSQAKRLLARLFGR